MIKSKPKKCIECGREDLPHFSKKRCKYCANKSYKKLASKTIINIPKKKDKSKLDDFFTEAISISNRYPYSFESGQRISNITRVNIAHIFPKRKYKSLSTNLDNFVLLTWDEHTRFDNYLDKFDFDRLRIEFPKSFDKMMEVYKKYKDIIEEGRLKHKIEKIY